MGLNDNAAAEITTGNGTIGEDGNASNDPANTENNSETDKSKETPSNEPTSQNDVNNTTATEQNYLGTFKTREEAENGFKSAQAKITEQGNKIKELEAKMQKADAPQLPDVNKEVAAVQEKINSEYSERLKGLGVKYSSYLPDEVEVNTIDDIVANLPSQVAAKFMSEFKDIQAEYNGKLNKSIGDVYQNANAKFEELKALDKEKYKDNEVVFNAWYNPPKTIEELSKLVADVQKQAIENYVKEQAAKTEDADHKKRIENGGSGSGGNFGKDHIFTRTEIDKMSDAEFLKHQTEISRQVAAGLVE